MARLFARVFEHVDFRGQYRFLRGDIASFPDQLGFNDRISSIIVYRGNDYQDGDVIRFHEHSNYGGGYLDLGPGRYANIHAAPYSFGDKISSANFRPFVPEPAGLGVRLMIRVYQHVDYRGQFRDILLSENNFTNIGFNDTVSSLRVDRGEDYAPGFVANFYQHADYGGGVLQPGNFGPGTAIPNIAAPPYSFNDVISSVRVSRLS